jgi:hypothetical protein
MEAGRRTPHVVKSGSGEMLVGGLRRVRGIFAIFSLGLSSFRPLF